MTGTAGIQQSSPQSAPVHCPQGKRGEESAPDCERCDCSATRHERRQQEQSRSFVWMSLNLNTEKVRYTSRFFTSRWGDSESRAVRHPPLRFRNLMRPESLEMGSALALDSFRLTWSLRRCSTRASCLPRKLGTPRSVEVGPLGAFACPECVQSDCPYSVSFSDFCSVRLSS